MVHPANALAAAGRLSMKDGAAACDAAWAMPHHTITHMTNSATQHPASTPRSTTVRAEPASRVSFWGCYAGSRITAHEYAVILAAAGSPRVCATLIPGRCGSTLLANLVTQWACCGQGNEVFNERPAERWRARAKTAHEFFGRALRTQQLGGVFWFQATPQRYDHLLSKLDPAISTTWRLSAILRADVVAQAMSYVYAIGSGIWHSFSTRYRPESPIDLPGDLDVMADRVFMWAERIVAMEARIRAILERQPGPSPLVLFHEDIVREPQAAVRRFCHDAGVVAPHPEEPFQQAVSRLAKRGEADLRERLFDRHAESLRCLDQFRREGILKWAAQPPPG